MSDDERAAVLGFGRGDVDLRILPAAHLAGHLSYCSSSVAWSQLWLSLLTLPLLDPQLYIHVARLIVAWLFYGMGAACGRLRLIMLCEVDQLDVAYHHEAMEPPPVAGSSIELVILAEVDDVDGDLDDDDHEDVASLTDGVDNEAAYGRLVTFISPLSETATSWLLLLIGSDDDGDGANLLGVSGLFIITAAGGENRSLRLLIPLKGASGGCLSHSWLLGGVGDDLHVVLDGYNGEVLDRDVFPADSYPSDR
ncbi:hypothetical protein BDK51DRAFT_51693 [Blyttiomyces helicus]|uniref:Uncharacterized protein n=1 Tax=Blyttiomyces helicus TaxID=388810 RepID=A0A4P9WIG7_9FUNG|nr:hypothetical protein BDK51DRAFT_51693 [Blyttiomyces helicus]|eukprot:RKO92669.1 hypothetical protein BDK51DRAFT_51693 [Blyttiomyces helicus]